jgi:hypothetical protein
VLARLLLFGLLMSLPWATDAQCVPKPYSAKQEVFSSVVQNLEASGVRIGPAGIELLLEERAERVLATLREYEGSPFPLETTTLEGAVHQTATGCDVSLSGHGKRGKVEIRGTITVANFRGTIRRQIGKETLSEPVELRRKLGELNEHQAVERIAPFAQISPTANFQLTTCMNFSPRLGMHWRE